MKKLFKDIKRYPKRSRFIRAIKQFFDFKTFKKDKGWWWLEFQSAVTRVFEYSPPFSWINDARWWIVYRTTKRFHIVDTKLKPGYYDSDWVMLHACFQILVEFVEEELAWSGLWTIERQEDDIEVKIKVPWYMTSSCYVKKNAEWLGLRCLEREMKATFRITDQDEDIPESGLQVDHEGTPGWHAKEQKELYLWWKHDREKERKQLDEEKYDFEKEKALDDKDNAQLLRLVKIREGLWT